MKKKTIICVMMLVVTAIVNTGCSKQEVPVETVSFETELVSESSIEKVTTEVEQTETTENEQEEQYIYIDMVNPSWDYYHEDTSSVVGKQTVFLEKLDETPNGIGDVSQWIASNELDFQPMPYSDENYSYNTFGYNAFDTYELQLQELSGDGRMITCNFTAYNYANDFAESERDFVFQRIIWAKVEENILYVATGHYTYAASSPHNAYITAIDMNNYHVIWKTAPLVCNSLSFELVGDAIVCGYGFTDEDDFLYILDKKTGMVQESIPLKKAPEYIYKKGDILYVKTYDADLRFQIVEEIDK